jgi:flagellar motor switch protein FliN/FliY
MTTKSLVSKSENKFSDVFFESLANAMTLACDSSWSISSVSHEDVPEDEAEPVRIMLTLDGSLCGKSLLELNNSEAVTFVSKQLHRSIKELGEEENEVLRKLVETASLTFCASTEQEYGSFRANVSLVTEQLFEREDGAWAKATSDDGSCLSIVMYNASALNEALSTNYHEISTAVENEKAEAPSVEKKKLETVNLDLVMNVELNVTLRFGQRHLTLREVLDLTSGSVVELDRQVDEPVELLLNGEVIARGEAVVIDGNYGLRVSEVIKPVSSMVLD